MNSNTPNKPRKPRQKADAGPKLGFYLPRYKKDVINRLNALWPHLFNDKLHPLQCDMRSHLLVDAAKRGIECDPALLRLAIEYYGSQPRYLLNVYNGVPRVRLDGGTEEVKRRHKDHARAKLIREFGYQAKDLPEVK